LSSQNGGFTQSLCTSFAVAVVLHLSTPSSKLGSSPNEERLFNFVEKAFVASIGTNLEEFAGDIKAVLELKIKSS
jgi:hypothetical protein